MEQALMLIGRLYLENLMLQRALKEAQDTLAARSGAGATAPPR